MISGKRPFSKVTCCMVACNILKRTKSKMETRPVLGDRNSGGEMSIVYPEGTARRRWGDGTVLYLDCGGGYTTRTCNQIAQNYIHTAHAHTHTHTRVHVKQLKTECGL